MQLNGVPNDIINNLNPLSLIVFIPIFDNFIYPALRKAKIRFTPLKRITLGFFMGSLAMISACIVQVYIYRKSPCGNQANKCDDPAPINVWVQTLSYVLIGFSEIFASITGLEYAFTKAPKNMRSLVMAVFLFMSAISSAIAQGLTALSEDPLLVWNYGTVAVLAALGGAGFWLSHHKLDAEEDRMNLLPESHFAGRRGTHEDEEGSEEECWEGGGECCEGEAWDLRFGLVAVDFLGFFVVAVADSFGAHVVNEKIEMKTKLWKMINFFFHDCTTVVVDSTLYEARICDWLANFLGFTVRLLGLKVASHPSINLNLKQTPSRDLALG